MVSSGSSSSSSSSSIFLWTIAACFQHAVVFFVYILTPISKSHYVLSVLTYSLFQQTCIVDLSCADVINNLQLRRHHIEIKLYGCLPHPPLWNRVVFVSGRSFVVLFCERSVIRRTVLCIFIFIYLFVYSWHGRRVYLLTLCC
jgi:hypothetical protein